MPRKSNHKSGVINSKQRYLCKNATTFYRHKIGKKIDDYYVTKALQLYLEGLSFREIERIMESACHHQQLGRSTSAIHRQLPPNL
jgi:transposase-like protein